MSASMLEAAVNVFEIQDLLSYFISQNWSRY
jgi:hypothetical protein